MELRYTHMSTHTPRLFGFTLLELLVVISIIGILTAIALPAFSVTQKQGKDARRRGDMKSYQNCMEQAYVADGSTYVGTTGVACNDDLKDPGTTSYLYGTPTETAYCACAKLDNKTSGNGGGCVGDLVTQGDVADPNDNDDYFCVHNLQ